ncbi:MAG: (d)CMP kinase [Gemmataceae bacterium]|nr:(d)CMP kinase [Gemmata sp.]MDW8198826.1 (d)CMP kinase [Gemmataceae bacterium]
MIVTIDGPSGVGKSTVTKALATRLGFDYLDTGAMYRAVALAMLRRNIPWDDAAVAAVLPELTIELPPGQVWLNGEDVSAAIRSPAVSQAASQVAVLPSVRRFLAEQQRRIAAGKNIVCEGRDQGTFVFPQAECKFFLQADARVRAARRAAELQAHGQTVTVESVLADQEQRDRRDALRELAPLRPAADALVVDTTNLTLEQVIETLERVIRARQAGAVDEG